MIARIPRAFPSQKYAPGPLRGLLTIQRSTHPPPQIISTEGSLIKATRTVRSMRNAFAPVNKLPPELLTHVCAPPPGLTSRLAHRCAQVCRYWRNTLLASPLLWNVIHTNNPMHTEVHLPWSGKVPLEVFFHGGSSTGQFFQKVVPHMDRVQRLYLSLRVPGCEQILDSLQVGQGTSLRRLDIKKASTRLILSASMMEKISSFAINLATLSLRNVDTNLSSLTFPHLLHFASIMDGRFEGPRVSDVVDFIRGSPALVRLSIHRVSYSRVDDVDTHIEPVTLQHLEFAGLGGRLSQSSLDSVPYIEVDILPYLHLPQVGRRIIHIHPIKTTFPHDTSYFLTLVHAWKFVSGSGDGFTGGAGISHISLSIEESPRALAGRLDAFGQDGVCVTIFSSENTPPSNQSWPTTNWETATTGEEPEAGDDDHGIQAQLSRLGRYLEPLRWRPSPLAALRTLIFGGFGYTRNKEKYLRYLRGCFRELYGIHDLQVEETSMRMIAYLLRPFKDVTGEMVLLSPKLDFLSFDKCIPIELPLPTLIEVLKERAELGSVLETILVDDEEVDISELSDVRMERSHMCIGSNFTIRSRLSVSQAILRRL